MGIMNRMLAFVGVDYEDEDEEMLDERQEKPHRQRAALREDAGAFHDAPAGESRRNGGKVVKLNNSSSNKMEMVVVCPEEFDDAKEAADHLKRRRPVVLNLEGMEIEEARRIFDFLSGAVYTVSGSIQKVSAGIFLLAPNDIGIVGSFREEKHPARNILWN